MGDSGDYYKCPKCKGVTSRNGIIFYCPHCRNPRKMPSTFLSDEVKRAKTVARENWDWHSNSGIRCHKCLELRPEEKWRAVTGSDQICEECYERVWGNG